jgi:thiosulfate sulfurtransferase
MNLLDITPGELLALRAEHDLMIFDTRDAASYAHGHIEGAIPFCEHGLAQLVNSELYLRPVLVYCHRGLRSRDVCGLIAGFGFTRAYNLKGGWQAWEKFANAFPPELVRESPRSNPLPRLAV